MYASKCLHETISASVQAIADFLGRLMTPHSHTSALYLTGTCELYVVWLLCCGRDLGFAAALEVKLNVIDAIICRGRLEGQPYPVSSTALASTPVVACAVNTEPLLPYVLQAAESDQPGQDWQQGVVPKQSKRQLGKVRHSWLWVGVSPQDPKT